MRDLRELDRYRFLPGERVIMGGAPNSYPANVGCFTIPRRDGSAPLRIMASNAIGWDHVSVSLQTRCPTWEEMERVKRLFFRDDETAMQLHVPPSEHKNCHPYCLHLWRPHEVAIPRPPSMMVAP